MCVCVAFEKTNVMLSPAFAPLPWTREERKKEYSDAARAKARVKRLNKESNNVPLAIFYDVLYGAVPWLVGVAAATSILFAIHEADADAQRIFPQLHAPAAVGTVSTFAAFLLVSKINANLACNRTVIAEFGNLTGALVNLAVWVRSQRNTKGWGAHLPPRKRQREPAHVRDDPAGAGARVGAVHCQVQWPRRQSHSGAAAAGAGPGAGGHFQKVHHQERLHRAHVGLHGHRPHDQRANRRHPGADQKGQRVFRAVCAAQRRDGGGGVDHGHGGLPAAVHHRRDALHCLCALPAAGGRRRPIPTNRGNAVWLAGVVVLCTAVFFQISDRYWNPMALRSKKSGQAPLVSKACVATEVAIVEIFSKAPSQRLGDAAAAAAWRFSLGSVPSASPR